MDRYFESCEEFYARQEEAARWAEELDEEEDDGSDAPAPERGGGFV